jgi:hypothetical protein
MALWCILGAMTSICKEVPKSFDFLIMIVSPQKTAHVSRMWQGICPSLQIHLAVTSVGHGVFKGVKKCRKIPQGEEKGKRTKIAVGRQTIAMAMIFGIEAYARATATRRGEGVVDLRGFGLLD